MYFWINTFEAFLLVSFLTTVSPCQPPDAPTGGYYKPNESSYLPGDKIHYFCYRGYMRVGKESRSCQLGGKWSGQTPFCDAPVKLKNPQASSTAHSGASVHRTIDNDTSKCFSTDKGTGERYFVYLDEPAVVHTVRIFLSKGLAKLNISLKRKGSEKKCATINLQLEEKQWISVSCETEMMTDSIVVYDISDSKNSLEICEIEAYVKDGAWCRNPPDMYIANGRLLVSREKATLECSKGYKPGYNIRLVCDENGKWSGGILQCEEMICDRMVLNSTRGGDWQVVGRDGKLSIGSQKKLKCESGYKLVGGPDTVTCQLNGSWTHTSARCEGQKSKKLEISVKGVIIAVSIVVCFIVLLCVGLVLFLFMRKRSKPVVVVLKPGESNSVTYNESEYSAIDYDTMPGPPIISKLPPESRRPPLSIPMDYTNPSDQFPPPYLPTHAYEDTQPDSHINGRNGQFCGTMSNSNL